MERWEDASLCRLPLSHSPPGAFWQSEYIEGKKRRYTCSNLTTPLHAPQPPNQFILPLILPAQLTAQISAQHQQMKWFCLDSCPRQRRGDRIVPTTHLPRTPGVIHVPGVSLGLVRGKWLCYSFERWRLRTENCSRHPQSPWQCCGVLGGLSLSCSQQVF